MTNNKAIELLDNLIGMVEDNHGSDYDKAIHMAIDALAADVRENVRGEWVTPTEKIYSMDGEDITPAYRECNRCHKVYVRTNDNFCPNCGADMRGEQE